METTKLNTVRLKDGSEYPLSASWNDLADKPLQTVQTVLFSDAAQSFSYVSNFGSYIYETNDASLLGKWYTAWKNAIVTIDGVQYLPEKQTASGENYLGDALRLQTGSAVTGEPYAIGVTDGSFIVALFADSAPEDTSVKVEHTISITLENDVIQSDYLPGPPEFDLAAMGLETVVPDGGVKTVTCEVDDLISAIKKGTVKLYMNAVVGANSDGTPIQSHISIVGNGLYMENSMYEFFNPVSFNGIDMQIIIWVTEADKTIHAFIKTVSNSVPGFDLTAMGLAAVSVGGSVSVTCDTTKLRSALDKGDVKITLSYQDGVDVTAQVTFIGAAMKMSGTYQLSFVGALGLTPMLFNVMVTDTAIKAQIITLAVPTTTGTTT